MPIYDYRCKDCNKTSELLIRADTIPACPECASQQLEKLVSMPATQGKTANFLKRARSQAAREGHFSNYKPSDLKR
jgi:putative FmdB family regulatory protein